MDTSQSQHSTTLEPVDDVYVDPAADATLPIPPEDNVTSNFFSTAPVDPDLEAVPSHMEQRAVDVSQDNDQASSNHQAASAMPTTLPVTDHEMEIGANHGKRGRKNRKKGKGKNKAAASTETQAVPVASSSNQTNFDQPHDQYTITDPVTVGDFEQQTDNIPLIIDSKSSQSQTDRILTADQSTHLPSPSMSSQGVLTEPVTTSSATNQTDAYCSVDQFTETVDMASDTPLPRPTFTGSNFSFQTDWMPPGVVRLDSASGPADASEDDIVIAADMYYDHVGVMKPSAYEDEVQHPTDEDEVHPPADISADEDEIYSPAEGDEDNTFPDVGVPYVPPGLDESLPSEDEDPEQTGLPAHVNYGQGIHMPLDEPFDAEDVQQFQLPAVDIDLPTDDEIVDLHVPVDDEEARLRQQAVGHDDVDVPAENADGDAGADLNAKVTAKPQHKKSCLTRRGVKYLTAITMLIIFLIALFIILQPSCCENSVYHDGFFGVRRSHRVFPPH